MSRKNIFLIIALGVLLLIAWMTIAYFTSFRALTVTLTQPDLTVDIHKIISTGSSATPQKQKITTLTKSSSISLQDGTYHITPTGNRYDTTPQEVIIEGKDKTAIVTPALSATTLTTLLRTEAAGISTAINEAYPQLQTSFRFSSERLLDQGQWYAASFYQQLDAQTDGDLYRIVLHKTNNEWKMAARPSLLLSKYDYPNIPVKILRQVNALQ